MKNPLIIANWKMKLGGAESVALAKKIAKAAKKFSKVELVLCPAFTELAAVGEALKGSGVTLGAQDCFWEESGAFTGEVSAKTLHEYGVRYVIVGHSERRQHLAETDEMVHRKVRLLLSLGLVPVVCVGETFEERQEGQKEVVVIRQVQRAANGIWLNKTDRMVIAYEPIWVIGSGQAVAPEEAEHTNQVIRQTLYDTLPNAAVDEQVRIIYGGSVDSLNVGAFLAESTVSGVLVGGASLDSSVFSALIAASAKKA